MIWEYKVNVFQSDVPAHRIAWASPAVDPETGNIYILTGGAEAIALSRDGKRLWSRSFGEEYAAFTTHGGRTMSPVVDGDLVIVSAAVSNWGSAAARAHRLIGLDKRTGDVRLRLEPGWPAVRHCVRATDDREHQRPAVVHRSAWRWWRARDQGADR